MRFVKILVALVLILFSAVNTNLQALTLEESIAISERNNLGYRSSLLEKKLDQPAIKAAWAELLPRISIGYNFNQSRFYNPTYLNPDGTVATYPLQQELTATSIDPNTGFIRIDSLYTVTVDIPEGERRGSSLFLRLEETLYDGGRNYLNLQKALVSRDLRDADLSASHAQLRHDVVHAFSEVVAARKLHELSGVLSEQRRLQLEAAELRYETGSVTRRDVMQAEIDLGRSINDSLNSLLEVNRRYEELNKMLNFPIDSIYTVVPQAVPQLDGYSLDQLIEMGLSGRPDFHGAKKQMRLQENELKISRSAYLPVVGANLLHSRSEQSGVNVGYTLTPRNRYTEVGLSASWIIFDRFNRDLRVQESRIRRKQAEIATIELEITVKQQIRAVFETLKSLERQSAISGQNADLAQKTLEFELERYRLGSASLLELGAAQLSLAQAAADNITIEKEYQKAFADLEAAVNKELR